MLLVVGDKQLHATLGWGIQPYVTCGWGYTIVCYMWFAINNHMLLVVGDKQSYVTCGWG